ncbi:MAG: neutral zinc metallopeptidase [Microbacteriaceae bacterium]|jgi:predicted metalloprotease|nr:neutral zinc metallopeptidase [Microbacteriaceae bacterium]
MTFNDNARTNSGKVRRRGRTTGVVAGGGGVAVIALFLLSQFLGVDLTGLAGGGSAQQGADEVVTECQSGAESNATLTCRIDGAVDSLDTYWSATLTDSGVAYRPAEVILFSDQTNTGCGGATSATGPFYCPADELIYIDTTFFDELQSRFGSSGGPLSQMYVVAHEWGHHVQNVSGTMNGLDLQQSGPGSDGIRLEVQADCFAGAWAGAAATIVDESGTPFLEPVTDAQVADALSAAAAVGDDRIQAAATGEVNPETWTHGSSEQRQRWFLAGYNGGPEACNTFEVSEAEL